MPKMHEKGEVADAVAEEVGGAGLAELAIHTLGHVTGLIAAEAGVVGLAIVLVAFAVRWIVHKVRRRAGRKAPLSFDHASTWKP